MEIMQFHEREGIGYAVVSFLQHSLGARGKVLGLKRSKRARNVKVDSSPQCFMWKLAKCYEPRTEVRREWHCVALCALLTYM